MDRMLTVEEVAAILKVQPLTVRQMLREGRIRGFKIGKAWRTTLPILEEDIDCMRRGVRPPRLEQAGTESEAAPAQKRRAKAEPPAPEAVMPVSAETAPAPAETAPPPPPAAAPETPTEPLPQAAEETEAPGKRRRKSSPEENSDQQLLF